MVRLVIFMKRKPGMSLEEFERYWREVHAPLLKNTADFSRHVRRYLQGYLVAGAQDVFRTAGPQYDGVAELWFDSVEDMKRAFSEPCYREIIRADERKFVDASACSALLVNQVAIISEAQGTD